MLGIVQDTNADTKALENAMAAPGGLWKNCKAGHEAGSFPFFKRVCDCCCTKFTNFNISSTCYQAGDETSNVN